MVVRGANNQVDAAALESALRKEEERVRERLGRSNVAEHPVVAAWRDAYRRFGAKPSEHRSSIEAMLRRVVKPDRLPVINPLVAIGNIVSLRHLLPAGVHPLVSTASHLELRHAQVSDTFLPADGSAAEHPPVSEVVFTQGSEVLTRRWTWRQAAGTQTQPSHTDVFFNVDGLPPTGDGLVRDALHDIERLVSETTGGHVVVSTVLSSEYPIIGIPFGYGPGS